MKKNFVLFSAIVGGALFFQGCQNVDEAVNKAKEEVKAEYEAKIEALNAEWTGNFDLVTGERDSLQAVLDSIYAPKETASAAKKPAAKKPATTTTPEPVDPKKSKMSGGDTQKTSTDDKKSKMSGENTQQNSTDGKKSKMSGGN